MKYIFTQIIAICCLSAAMTSCCDKKDLEPVYDPKTIEDVMAHREYYFTCYMNGELWYTVPPSDHSPFCELRMDFDNTPTHVGEGDYGHFSFSAYKYPDQNDLVEKEYWQEQAFYVNISENSPCDFGGNIDTIPYELSFDQYLNHCIKFLNGFYTQGFIDSLGGGEETGYIEYTNVSNFHFWIDSVKTYNAAFEPDPNGRTDAVWGRIEGNFANAKGDTMRITEGVFKIRPGTWRYDPYSN